jgi:hypothetical protein
MATTTRKTAAAAPDPKRNKRQDPAAELLAAALQAMAAASLKPARRTAQARSEQLAQPLTDRDRVALERMGWTGSRLSSPKAAEPRPTAKVKAGPTVNPATYNDLSQERQASAQFWAGLCSTLARSGGRIWLPEVAAVASQLGVVITGPSQLAGRLSALTGLPVTRPTAEAGWLFCQIDEPMQGAELWAQLWATHLQAFTDAVAAESAD